MRKIGINLGSKTGLTIAEYATEVASLGFEAVFSGVPTPEKAAEIGNILAQNGLAWETMHAPFGHSMTSGTTARAVLPCTES